MIATILRQTPVDRRARVTAWRQLSDILAQRGNQLGHDDIRRALHALAVLRPNVPEAVRRDCARAIARHGAESRGRPIESARHSLGVSGRRPPSPLGH